MAVHLHAAILLSMVPEYSKKEEWLNIFTHGFGLVLSIIGLAILLVSRFHTISQHK